MRLFIQTRYRGPSHKRLTDKFLKRFSTKRMRYPMTATIPIRNGKISPFVFRYMSTRRQSAWEAEELREEWQ